MLVFTANAGPLDKLVDVISTKAIAAKMENIVNVFALVYMYCLPYSVADKCWLTKLTNK